MKICEYAFCEQVRGVLALVHEIERRCEDAD